MAVKQSQQAKEFAEFWLGKGDEKQETQRFWFGLLTNVLGIKDADQYIEFEKKVKLAHTSYIDAYIPKTKVLIEQKSADIDLHKEYQQSDGKKLTPYQQAKRYANEMPYSTKPRWIVVCNFQEFLVFDLDKPQIEPEQIFLKDLEKEIYRLHFLIDENAQRLTREEEISLKAGELVGKLYNALLKEYINPDAQSLISLNILCVRIVFCLYAEDAGLFATRTSFEDYIKSFSPENLRKGMIDLFKALNTKVEDRDKYDVKLKPFPYADGGLFMAEDIEIPNFTQEIVDVLVDDCCTFDWSEISPTIFGALFESTLNPITRREGGMHYTSIANIHKLIDPLFMDELTEELNDILSEKCSVVAKKQKLFAFQHKLATLRFLDPACGSGNFLTETYLSLRRLENKIIAFINDGEKTIGYNEFICVKISQFYGIEINDFAVTVAKTALWIAESQMTVETEIILGQDIDFLPLKSNSNIIEGNALKINWKTLEPEDTSIYSLPNTLFFGAMDDKSKYKHYDYIIGNPPFVGHQYRTKEQQFDMDYAFKDFDGNFGKLDYVACWYKKAADIMQKSKIECAFVSTNSIVQGESVATMWKPLFNNKKLEIIFAHQSFEWESESTQMAHVHCVIIGFVCGKTNRKKYIFKGETKTEAKNINGYLLDAPNVFIQNRTSSGCNELPEIIKGNQPTDGRNLILSEEEKEDLINKYPKSKYFVKQYMGAEEFLNNKKRWCLWLKNVPPNDYRNIPFVKDRLKKVVEFRKSSPTLSVQRDTKTPMLFTQIRQPESDYLLIPRVSSELREYIPIGFVDKDCIASDSVQIIPNATLYLFGILTSNIHNSWMRIVCGRLESRFRYSPAVYYNFPWCNPNEKQKAKIEKTAQKILDIRSKYEEASLADLYDNLTMPPDLRKAHRDNDLAVLEAYGFDKNITEDGIVAKLFELYEEKNK
ncbi:MAG: class I SAM-dependent DNA methyltransferase [Bacteroidales bacterium]|nr:class I SAM-dependent DNA methyltransferase [Bacteroidales bacterium]